MNGIVEQLADDINRIRPPRRLNLAKCNINIGIIGYTNKIIQVYYCMTSSKYFWILECEDPTIWLFCTLNYQEVDGSKLDKIFKAPHKGRDAKTFLLEELKMYDD